MEQGFHILVTAGPTRTPLDDVRYWANIFTGNTGLQIALAMRDLGHVTLLTSNPDHLARLKPGGADYDARLTVIPFVTFSDLDLALAKTVLGQALSAVFMTAAVSDYQSAGAFCIESTHPVAGSNPPRWQWVVRDIQKPKIASNHAHIAFAATPTPKLIDKFRRDWNFRGLLCKFKLEAGLSEEDLKTKAQASRIHSQADVIVANTLEMVYGADPAAYIIDATSCQRIPRGALPQQLRAYLLRTLPRKPHR